MKLTTPFLLLIAFALATARLQAADTAPALSPDPAFEQLKTYDEGRSTAPLLIIERHIGQISKDPVLRQQAAGRLAAILVDPQISDAARLFICQQLRLVAGDAQVPVLAPMLDDARHSHLARIALQDMPGATAGRALVEALGRLKGDDLVGVINSVGARRESAAVGPLARLLADADAKVAASAAAALGKIGTKEAAEALASAKSSPAIHDAQLACAAELARNGDVAMAKPIYRRLIASDQPLNIRLAALHGLAKAAPSLVAPEVFEALTSSDAVLQRSSIDMVRTMPGEEATSALRQVLPKLEPEPRLLALGALAERGERSALVTLNGLAADKDLTVRAGAMRELRRLRYAAQDSLIREQIAAVVQEAASSIATLSPPPYEQSVIDQRKRQLAAGLDAGDKLLCYLDCGVEARCQEAGAGLRQVGGQSWLFPNSLGVAHPTFGTVAFDAPRLEFEIAGLDPRKRYALGFSWWDFDNGGRAQSVQLSSGDSGARIDAARSTKLPAFNGKNERPVAGQLPIDPALYSKGRVRMRITRESGPNAVVSELWLIETKPDNASAREATWGGNPVRQVSSLAQSRPPADLAPPAEGTKILLVTGDDYPGHPWQQTAPELKGILEKDPRLKVRIVEDPEALASARLKSWDAVIIHFMDWEKPGPGPEARQNLAQFVSSGKGMMLTHFACGAWDNGEWPEFKKLAGRVWDPKLRGHDPHGKFRVDIADPEHPITKGLKPFETVDELYTCLAGDAPIHVVAKATSKVDKKDYPMAFVLNYGQGRVFHCVLGHDARAYTNNPSVGELMRRGCAWAAGLAPVSGAGTAF